MPFGPIVEPGPATQPGRRGVRVRWGGPQGSGGSEHRALLTGRVRVDKTDGLQLVVVCALPRHDCSVGESPTRPTCAPAGSTGSGAGGNEWTEALLEKAPTGGQQVMRAAT